MIPDLHLFDTPASFWVVHARIFRGTKPASAMLAPNTTVIPKERIPTLRFPKQPVPLTDQQHKDILEKLQWATHLGNAEHGKCRIVFQDDEGMKAVETTVWTYDPENIVLKYGTTIPVSRVVSIEIP